VTPRVRVACRVLASARRRPLKLPAGLFGTRDKVTLVYVPADTRLVDKTALDDLRTELAALEAAETRISAERRRLHERIDLGFSTAETLAREREVSDERRQLHRRIDLLRELLQAQDRIAASAETRTAPEPRLSRLSQWEGISAEVTGADDLCADEIEP
jgi:hypothetical protein